MKIIIQIPCYNEAETLPLVLQSLPRKLKGFGKVEWLVIDDGSSDSTVNVAKEFGVHHVICLKKHRGLARAFSIGIETCLEKGAEVIVNLDADNQYDVRGIPDLVAPILEGKADLVIGERPISTIEHFSRTKKILQRLGSFIVRVISRTDVGDATSGFRAFSKYAALRTNVFNDYTYTLESIIQAGQNGMRIISIPIQVNRVLRPSRLVKSTFAYVKFSAFTIVRIFIVYKPFAFFVAVGTALSLIGIGIGVRFLFFFFNNVPGHTQSLILTAILVGMGFLTIMVGFVADLIAANRKLLEEIQYRLRQIR